MSEVNSDAPAQRQAVEGGEGPAVIVTDVHGRIVVWDHGAERLYGWAADEVLGRPIIDVVVPEQLQGTAAEIMEQLAEPSSGVWRGPFRVRHKDGAAFEVYVEDTPIVIDGQVVAIMGQSTPLQPLRSLDTDLAALSPDAGLGALLDARLRWYESFRTAARSAISIRELDELLRDVLATVANSLDADAASLLVADESDVLVARAAFGWEGEILGPVRIPPGRGVSGKIVATKEPVLIDDLDRVDVASPELRHSRFHSFVGVPLIERGRVIGVLHATDSRRGHFSASDVRTLSKVSGPLASAVQRVRLFAQMAQLANPTRLPSVPGVELHGRCRAADGGVGGGDWFDAVVRHDGSMAVVIGDAAGHGIAALVTAGSVRHALIAYLHEGHSPAEALSLLGPLMTAASFAADDGFLTVQACVYDPRTRVMTTASAGHPPLLHMSGGTSRLGPQADPPISPGLPGVGYRDHAIELDRNDLVVLYTDGLIERRGEPLDKGLERLRATLTEQLELPLGRVADHLLGMSRESTRPDDTSVVLLRVN